MTISSTTVKNSYSGNDSTTSFAYNFKIFADSDLIVIIRSSAGTETTKTLTTHYTVAGVLPEVVVIEPPLASPAPATV